MWTILYLYLTDEEVNAMYDMELTDENEIVRDIFLLGYFSCQRYSDYCKLREENFITYNKSGLITLTQKKTGKKVEVSFFVDRVYELCDKYHYEFPDIDVQKMNLEIKAVGYDKYARRIGELVCAVWRIVSRKRRLILKYSAKNLQVSNIILRLERW